MRGKVLYLVSGSCERSNVSVRAGRHPWFGPIWFGDYRGFATFVQTRSKRQAEAQYRRLKVAGRQMDIRTRKGTRVTARVLKSGKQC